ncbi:MAG: rhomboid family intramembrane serine protease [Pseudomonadota bacterium]
MSMNPNASPFNALPPIVWALFFLIFGIECIFGLGERGLLGGPSAVGWRLAAVNDYGFSGQAFDWMVGNLRLDGGYLVRLLTYPFVQGGFTQALFASVILLAMGKLVGEVMGQRVVLILFVLCGVFGAIVFGLLTDQAWLIGAFPCVYGLIGAYTFLLWQNLAGRGLQQLAAFRLIGLLMGIQLFFGMFFVVGYTWVAELAGFAFGFLFSPMLVPGGVARVINLLRRR